MERNLKEKYLKKRSTASFLFVVFLILSVAYYIIKGNILFSVGIFFGLIIVSYIFSFFSEKLRESAEIRKMEEVFPDFIELVSSNLRAGMTLDKALLLSSRKEFAPLDERILLLGKEIITGREIGASLLSMGERTHSEKIKKTINLIVSGLKSGGNVAVLLEETAVTMREKSFVEKKASSNVLMYVILISFATAAGAPALFALSTVLVSVMTEILSGIPAGSSSGNMPFSLGAISISTEFITIFSVIFLTTISVLSSLLLGFISKGDKKEGLKYAPFFVAIGLTIFFILKSILSNSFSVLFK